MDLKLTRDIQAPGFTLGSLYINDVLKYFSCEDQVRLDAKVPGQTAIPSGRYQVIINDSPHFERLMPLLLDVPDFEGVRIHYGNTAADSTGCILIGLQRTKNGVAMSRPAFDEFMPLLTAGLNEGEVWIVIS